MFSIFKPQLKYDGGVGSNDIQDYAIDPRMLGIPEIAGSAPSYAQIPFVIVFPVTTGAASVKIYTANSPFKFEILDVLIQPRGASTNGTMKITNGTNDITNAMVCAVDKTLVRPSTIDDAYSTIAKNGTLEVVCAGDTIGNTIGLVSITAVKR
jgi:hypothetical protein